MEERLIEAQEVAGSTPVGGTLKRKTLEIGIIMSQGSQYTERSENARIMTVANRVTQVAVPTEKSENQRIAMVPNKGH